MTRSMKLSLATASLVALTLSAAATPSAAQTAAVTPAASDETTQTVEQLVVTARRREEDLQDTPISITAFSGSGLAERLITNTEDLGRFTPNMVTSMGQPISGNSSAGAYFIRGIGQIDFLLNTDPGVGVYVDGVYIARAIGSFMDLLDLDRLEVLRGPQGTLFGRNTIGGAVSMTTRKPDDKFAASLDAVVGSYDRRDLGGTLNAPLSDRAFASIAVLWREQDGYVRRVTDDTRLGDLQSFSGRAALRLIPTDSLTIDLSYDAVRETGTSPPANVVQINETAAFASFYNGAIAGPPCVPPPSPLNNPRCFNSQWVPTDLLTEHGAFTSRQKTDVDGVTATAAWKVSDTLTLKSITGYRRTQATGTRDGDHTPIMIQDTDDTYTHTQKSEELQILGTNFGGQLTWIAGAYFFAEDGVNVEFVDFAPAKFKSGGSVDNKNGAVFGQFTYAFRPDLKLTAGARWTKDDKSFTPDQIVLVDRAGLFPPGSVPGFRIVPFQRFETSAERATPLINLSYEPQPDLMVYATYSEGFKSGGFTQRIFPPLPAAPSFGPERVKSEEAGAKWEGFEHRVRLNGAVFYTDYSDLQVQVLEGVQPLIRNAAGATIKGFEAELQAIPADGLRIDAGVGYTDAQYTSLTPSVLAAGVALGNSFPQVPKWTGNLGVRYRADLSGGLSLTPRVDYTYQSATEQDAANTPSLHQRAYGLLSAGLKLDAGRWAIELFGRNLTDERYFIGGFADLAVQGYAEAAIGQPRTWGLSLHLRN